MDALPQMLYIADAKADFENLAWVHRLHEKGIGWIILGLDESEFHEIHPDAHFLAFFHEKADLLKAICEALGLLFSVADSPEVALFSGAGGIHCSNTADLAGLKKEHLGLLAGAEVANPAAAKLIAQETIDYLLVRETGNENMDLGIPVYVKVASNTWNLVN